MEEKHYENFPVASLMLPAHLRRPVSLLYTFARKADDFADEGDLAPEERLRLLDSFRQELSTIASGENPHSQLFRDLEKLIHERDLPLQCFFDLLDAFSQDVVKKRYETFEELLDYCTRSADPVGRLLLALYGHDTPQNRRLSDRICSSLQIINFLQDVAIDWKMGRVYLPEEDLVRFGIEEEQIAQGLADRKWSEMMSFQIARARAMMQEGAPLAGVMRGRLGLEMKLIALGGLRILELLDECRGDVFSRRPKLGRKDWAILLFRAFLSPL